MGGDDVVVSGWFVLNAGKVYARCGRCHSHRVSYFRNGTRGLSPVCLDCCFGLPERSQKTGSAGLRRLDGIKGKAVQ